MIQMHTLFHWLLVVAGLVGFTARAETIHWFSDAEKMNLDSAGSPITSDFVFELGVFSGGFIPTASNISSWRAHWVPADSTSYHSSTKRFVDSFAVTQNTAPFTQGASAWIFGYRDTSLGSEWILFRNSGWTWPAPNPLDPIPTEWNTKDADQIVLGEINGSGSPHLMKSVALQSYAQWQAAHLTGVPLNGPLEDPDEDGVSNLLEFVFGTLPRAPGKPVVTDVSLIDGRMQMTIPRRIDRIADLKVEVSADLTNWNAGDSYTRVITSDAFTLVVQDLTLLNAGSPKRFMRLKAKLP